MNEEALVQAARAGDRDALDALVSQIQTRLYNLAVRMLWHPADAEDATQEILIKIVTHLADFRGESQFGTWCWRIATNHLLTTRKRRAEQHALSFDAFAAEIDQERGQAVLSVPGNLDERLLVEEAKVGCMQGMLLCLSREERAAYVLGEILGVSDQEGGVIFDISPAAYRKRLSRARSAIRSFMQATCGLADPANPCHCRRRAGAAIAKERLDPTRLLFAQGGEDPAVLQGIAEMDALERAGALFRTHPTYAAPERLRDALRAVLDGGQVSFLA